MFLNVRDIIYSSLGRVNQNCTVIVWWMMCCIVGWPGPALAPVAGLKTVLELDITAAAAAPKERERKSQVMRQAQLSMCSKWNIASERKVQNETTFVFYTPCLPLGK